MMENKQTVEETTKLVPEVYKDLAKPAIQEIGHVGGRTVKALLSPLRAMLWGWERVEGLIEEGINKRLENIPDERRKSPEPEIAVPIMQALSYTAHNETLREMYLNLLSNSMDVAREKDVHPSFVELIKQMNSLDAMVFEKIAEDDSAYQPIINPKIALKGQGKFFSKATPEWYVGWTVEGYNEFDVSASLVRLNKFGLIELMYDRNVTDTYYEELVNNEYLQSILTVYTNRNPDKELEVSVTKSVVQVNEYGRQFKNACR